MNITCDIKMFHSIALRAPHLAISEDRLQHSGVPSGCTTDLLPNQIKRPIVGVNSQSRSHGETRSQRRYAGRLPVRYRAGLENLSCRLAIAYSGVTLSPFLPAAVAGEIMHDPYCKARPGNTVIEVVNRRTPKTQVVWR